MRLRRFTLFVLFWVPWIALAQTITITNGVQNYASLTSTTVNMSGRCELWVTSSITPLSGCAVNLNSVDAWLFLPGIKPLTRDGYYPNRVGESTAANR